jgi:DNA-binding protein HU-beta
MNKNELVGVVAEKATITKAQAAEAVDAVFEGIAAALKAGEEVRLVGFGTFAVSQRKASTGRNPATGAEINIPASNQAKFKPGKGLKDSLNITAEE